MARIFLVAMNYQNQTTHAHLDDITNRILYRDGLILVINKPPGIAVHKTGQSRHNLEQYFPLLTFGLPSPPTLAHRLDSGTSGCLVLARQRRAAQKMQELFTNGLVKKTYLAWVTGVVSDDHGRIDIPLKKRSRDKSNWQMVADRAGSLTATTDFTVLHRESDRTLLKLLPHTGRTHQLRVHCQALGHPIIGDRIYGDRASAHPVELHLHALHIEIPLYPKKAPIVVTAPLPHHMQALDVHELSPL